MAALETIRLRGVRQNNLKGFDLDIPLGRYVVVTGLSGAGKSSLVFETLHAEGQRRYVETFSAYTRQFLELLAKPQVDSIENIRPSIAIEQSNTVKTSRSTVGTMTELTDYFKLWFSHVAACYDPATGERVEDDNPQTIWAKAAAQFIGATVLVAFRVARPENLEWREILQNLQGQSYQRVLVPHAEGACALHRIDDLLAPDESRSGTSEHLTSPLSDSATALFVVQDRIALEPAAKARFTEAVETALHFGQGEVRLFGENSSGTPSLGAARDSGDSTRPAPLASRPFSELGHYSRGLHSPKTGRRFRPAAPAMFSFNSPIGACPKCRGFGRVIDIDYRLAIPDETLSIDAGAIKCWEGEVFGESKRDLLGFAKKKKLPTHLPFCELTPAQRAYVIEGEPGYGENGVEWPAAWYGLKGFFRYLEARTYKMHYRVFLARYRSYNLCPECHGTRLQPEALCWKWENRTLPELYQFPVSELLALLSPLADRPSSFSPSVPSDPFPTSAGAPAPNPQSAFRNPHSSDLALDAILARLRYLEQVGLGYLTLDRQSRTLSGGEVERVNLTSCLGSSLVDTLFVLDEPSVGLHPRDIDRLIGIIRSLTAAGNTVVVVEHDESMIRAADHVIEIGPEPGAAGGHVVFQGDVPALLASSAALTGDYLSGRRFIPVPAQRRPVSGYRAAPRSGVSAPDGTCNSTDYIPSAATSAKPETRNSKPETPVRWLTFSGATKHNLRDLTVALPLGRFVALSGVSGSGKSTLLDHVIHQGLLAARRQFAEDPASIAAIHGLEHLGEIVLVDQSPLSRTPRSNAALYADAWDGIRNLFAATESAREAGFSASSFSFNAGDGRCDHCQGLGYEAVEMQFLSDVYVPCPICEGRRFKPEILACTWNSRSVADVLALTVREALDFFAAQPAIRSRLAPLAVVGLGYLTLGQPLNTLSGGEAQRLKLVKYLGNYTEPTPATGASLADARTGSVAAAPATSLKSQIPNLKSTATPAPKPETQNPKPKTLNPEPHPRGALLLLDEPTTGLHRHDVGRLLTVLHALVDQGHSVVVIEHNTDVLKNADWLIEVGPEGGAAGGRIVAEGTPEQVALTRTATAPYLRAALAGGASEPLALAAEPEQAPYAQAASANRKSAIGNRKSPQSKPLALAAEPSAPSPITNNPSPVLQILGARENNLRNLSLSIALRSLTVVTGVSGSGKSTLAFDIVFAEGQRRFMESMSPYARQFVEQLPRPAVDRVTGIPPTVAIEQRITRGGRKSTVATITEVAQYLRLLYAKLGIQHHPVSGAPIRALSTAELEKHFLAALATPAAKKAKHLYLCAPLVRGRKGHHQPIADWIRDHGFELMRADGRLLLVENFAKLDRFKEHNIEVVVTDLRSATTTMPGARDARQEAQKSAASRPSTPLASSLSPLASLSEALRLGKGTCFLLLPGGEIVSWFSTTRTDAATGETFPVLDPKDFSFASPKGWCPVCRGHGRLSPWMLKSDADDEETPPEIAELAHLFDDDSGAQFRTCPECGGTRLNRVSRAVHLYFKHGAPLSLPALLALTPSQLLARLRDLDLDARGKLIVRDIIPQIEERLKFMDEVGLAYLALERSADTLSGGEAQRIRLASQLGSNLSGVLYVLDEPSIGLHPRDNDRLIATLERLRAKGNTLLVVEHDDVVMDHADRIIDLGPGAGRHGGQLLADDTPANLRKNKNSLTGLYLDKGIAHPLRGKYREVISDKCQGSAGSAGPLGPPSTAAKSRAKSARSAQSKIDWLELTGARLRNLKSLDLRLPLGRLIMVAGPSGAGKSTLFRDLLHPAVACAIQQKKTKLTGRDFLKLAPKCTQEVSLSAAAESHPITDHPSPISPSAPFALLTGAAGFKAVVEVDQSPIGHTPRSTPATYLGVFDLVRQFLASIPESKIRGYTAGRFSFNTAGGRCETCAGAGRVKLEMNFMPDTFVTCEACGGRRYGPEILEIQWKGKNVADLLEMTFEEARDFFDFHSQLREVCALMCETGLGYLTLGQSSPTLSGGEAQRLKLVTELSRGLQSYKERQRGESPRNLYILEEPTIGLHLSDCEKLIHLLHRLVDQGHTVVVIEHHLDLLAEADWLVELGPEGGPAGGELFYQGPVSGVAKLKRSPTAPYLREKLAQ
ncbi:MAG TPA: excinuclease ABC subunit A [Opitutaceae bacterium]|nr:excinuclease ABC subunit A [Opitutaceae bacterium]